MILIITQWPHGLNNAELLDQVCFLSFLLTAATHMSGPLEKYFSRRPWENHLVLLVFQLVHSHKGKTISKFVAGIM